MGQRKNWSESFHLDKSNMFRILSVTKLLDIYVTYALLILFFCFFSFFQVTQVLSTLTFIACVVLIGKHIFSLVRKVNNNNFTRITLTSFSVLSDSQYIINCQIFPVYKTWIRKSRMVFKERKITFFSFANSVLHIWKTSWITWSGYATWHPSFTSSQLVTASAAINRKLEQCLSSLAGWIWFFTSGGNHTISWVLRAFWLVLAYDLLKDRRIYDVIIDNLLSFCYIKQIDTMMPRVGSVSD